jgi:Xaa-Pro dipeptidase
MQRFAELCQDSGFGAAGVGVDSDGYGGGHGYQGPKLSELLRDATITPARPMIEALTMIKSPEGIGFIRENAKWGNLAHTLLQQYTRPGLNETEVSARASFDATQAMIRTLDSPGSAIRTRCWSPTTASSV